jgi:hypothetical protein
MEDGFSHYDFWKMDVVSDWAKAVEELGCIPYILDVRTFGFKAMNSSLPHLDFVINLNAGNFSTSTLGLIPSICGFLSIPCIPCDTAQAVTGEEKILSNLIAKALKIRVPEDIDHSNQNGIYRPKNLGSSCGVQRGLFNPNNDGIYQEFIPGLDMTTPILFNPLSNTLDVLPAIVYTPETLDINWFLGEKEKSTHEGYRKINIEIDDITKQMYLSMARSFGIKTFCRIDARLKCNSKDELLHCLENEVSYEKVYFLEINAMPTIRENINFCNSLKQLSPQSPMGICYETYRTLNKNSSLVGFILFCSLSSFIKHKDIF